ncbi:MAG TPA: protein kinase [bacterium]|nr:protein kinase [bacterium]
MTETRPQDSPAEIGGFRIEREIARGGMGVVYLGHDARLGRSVAVKMMHGDWNEDSCAAFEREARTIAQLSHPNVAVVHAFGEHEGACYLVMEYLEGQTLRELIDARGALPPDEAVALACDVASGMAAAHERGVVHRDLKPQNVVRTRDGLVKILDFGLAEKAARDLPDDLTRAVTEDSRIRGTVGYMAPEQIRGEPVGAPADVFALGVLLHELLTGRHPFPGKTRADVSTAVLRDPPAPLEGTPSVSGELRRVVERALAKDPAARYATAAGMLEDLRRVPSGDGARNAPSIAVLPFANMSSDPDNEYFTDGLAEEILNSLCRVDSLRVAARTSSFAFKGRNEDVREIGRQLGVRTVLEGSVRRSGDRLRITAQLVNVGDGYHLWSRRYDRKLEDVFAVQDEIAECIADSMEVVLTEREREAIATVKPADLRAYDYYLRGMQLLHRTTVTDIEQARSLFRRAVEIDPEYPLGYSGLTFTCGLLHMWIRPKPEYQEEADRASRRAVELGPAVATAHVARGFALTMTGDFPDAQVSFMRALELEPRNYEALYYYGRAAVAEGLLDKAAGLFRRAAEVNPDDFHAPTMLISVLGGLEDRAEEQREWARLALERVERHLELYPDDVRAVYFGSGHWAHLGEPEQAVTWARRALEMAPGEPGVRYNVACTYAHIDREEEALDLLERNIDSGWGYLSWIEKDADLKSLREHPRFRKLLGKLAARDAHPPAGG